jgi:hypothetical protein
MTATQLCAAMLPIHRVLPVGGVLLAILILVLALTPPDGSRGPLSSPGVPARGALSDRDRQAETRQFLIHAALKRADQLSRLRDLPDTPAHSEEPQLAGLPAERSDADPEESGSTNATPAVTIPIEIGGPSIDVPIPSPQDIPLTLKQPEQSKTQQEMRRRAQRPRRTTVTRTQSSPLNFFEILFGQQSASISQQAGSQPYPYPLFGPQQVQQFVEQRADRFSAIPATGVRQPADGLSAAAATTGPQLSADRSAAATTTVRLRKPTGRSVHPHSLARYFPGTRISMPGDAKG